MVKHFQQSRNIIFKDKDDDDKDKDRKRVQIVKGPTVVSISKLDRQAGSGKDVDKGTTNSESKTEPPATAEPAAPIDVSLFPTPRKVYITRKSKTDDLETKSSPHTYIEQSLDDRQEHTKLMPTVPSPPELPEVIKAVIETPLTVEKTVEEPASAEKPLREIKEFSSVESLLDLDANVNLGFDMKTAEILEDGQLTKVSSIGSIDVSPSELKKTVAVTAPETLGITAETILDPVTPYKSLKEVKPLTSAESLKDLELDTKFNVEMKMASTLKDDPLPEVIFKLKADTVGDELAEKEVTPSFQQLLASDEIPLVNDENLQFPLDKSKLRTSHENLLTSKSEFKPPLSSNMHNVPPIDNAAHPLWPTQNPNMSSFTEPPHMQVEKKEDEKEEEYQYEFNSRRKSTILAIKREEVDAEFNKLALKEEGKKQIKSDISKYTRHESAESAVHAKIGEELSQPSTSPNRRKSIVFGVDQHKSDADIEADEDIKYQEIQLVKELPVETTEKLSANNKQHFKGFITSDDISEYNEPLELPMGDSSELKTKTVPPHKKTFSLNKKSEAPLDLKKQAVDTIVNAPRDLHEGNPEGSDNSDIHTHTQFVEGKEEVPMFTARRKSTIFAFNRDEIAAELDRLAEKSESEEEILSGIPQSFKPVILEKDSSEPSSSYNKRKPNVFTVDAHDLVSETEVEKGTEYQDLPLTRENSNPIPVKATENISSAGINSFKVSVTSDDTSEKNEPLKLPIGDLSDSKVKTEPPPYPRKPARNNVARDVLLEDNRENSDNTQVPHTQEPEFTAMHQSAIFADPIDAELQLLAQEKEEQKKSGNPKSNVAVKLFKGQPSQTNTLNYFQLFHQMKIHQHLLLLIADESQLFSPRTHMIMTRM